MTDITYYSDFGVRWSQTGGGSLPLIDYGARMYDPTIARWMSQDPLAEKYYPLSPYSYCAGDPIVIVDDGGTKIIFVNGYHGSLVGMKEGGEKYWKPESGFIKKAMQVFNDNKVAFPNINHNFLSSAKKRRTLGYEYAKENFSDLTGDLSQGEAVRFVTHSMGAAFAEGMADFLIEQGIGVDALIHFEPYQADAIDSNGIRSDVLSIDFQDTNDWVIRFIQPGDIHDADNKIRISRENPSISNNQIHIYHIRRVESWEQIESIIQNFLKVGSIFC